MAEIFQLAQPQIIYNFDTMIKISFLDFLKEKRFGEIKLGDPKSSVLKLLGEPDGYSNPEFNPKYYDAIQEFCGTKSKS